MDGTSTHQGIQRYQSLDRLRGIAAMAVLFTHALLHIPGPWAVFKFDADGQLHTGTLDLYPIRILWSGHQAVILFFVLSGFALYMMLESMKSKHTNSRSTWVFALSRWLRLYPVYIFSIGFAIVLYGLFNSMGIHRDGPPPYPRAEFEISNFLGHLLLIGPFDVSPYNPPIWSIVEEMRISLIFPLIYILVQRLGAHAVWAAVAMPIVCAVVFVLLYPILRSHQLLLSLALSIGGTLSYSAYFIFGAVIARFRDEITRSIKSYSRRKILSILFVSLFLYTYSYGESWLVPIKLVSSLFVGAGACGIIALALSFPILEKSRTLEYLGKISYSLYLMHFTCVVAIYLLIGDKVPFYVTLLLMIVSSLAVSSVTWRLVESPALQWSRTIRTPRLSMRSSAPESSQI